MEDIPSLEPGESFQSRRVESASSKTELRMIDPAQKPPLLNRREALQTVGADARALAVPVLPVRRI